MMSEPNYNLKNNNTESSYLFNQNSINTEFNLPKVEKNFNEVKVDLTKYKNNKPIRKTIRGSIING